MPDGLGLHARLIEECRIARSARANLLLIGQPLATTAVVNTLWAPTPAQTWFPGHPLDLPEGGGLLFLYDVDSLPRTDQSRLRDWLQTEAGRTQVVSTSRSPLMLRVAACAFDEALYYRLNTIYVNANDLLSA